MISIIAKCVWEGRAGLKHLGSREEQMDFPPWCLSGSFTSNHSSWIGCWWHGCSHRTLAAWLLASSYCANSYTFQRYLLRYRSSLSSFDTLKCHVLWLLLMVSSFFLSSPRSSLCSYYLYGQGNTSIVSRVTLRAVFHRIKECVDLKGMKFRCSLWL